MTAEGTFISILWNFHWRMFQKGIGFADFLRQKIGENYRMPVPHTTRNRSRSAMEKLLSSDLWAARIENSIDLVIILFLDLCFGWYSGYSLMFLFSLLVKWFFRWIRISGDEDEQPLAIIQFDEEDELE